MHKDQQVKSGVPTIRIFTLGTFRMERRAQGHYVHVAASELHNKRVGGVLGCLLAAPGRRLGREQIIDLLWPEREEIEELARELDRGVYELRQKLEPERDNHASGLLRQEFGVLTLAGQSEIWVDADTFEGMLVQARGTSNVSLREQLLKDAAVLYEGDFLPFSHDIALAEPRREALRRNWLGAMFDLADLQIARRDFYKAMMTLERVLATDRANETAIQRYMLILAFQRRRGEAIRLYRNHIVASRHAGIKTSPRIRALYRAIFKGLDDTTLGNIARGHNEEGT